MYFEKTKYSIRLLAGLMLWAFTGVHVFAGNPPYRTEVRLTDNFDVHVMIPGVGDKYEPISVDTRRTAEFGTGDGSVLGDIRQYYVFTKVYDPEAGDFIDAIADTRNYVNCYIEYPLSIVVEDQSKVGSQYTVKVTDSEIARKKTVECVEIYDKLNPEKAIVDMYNNETGYTFTITSGELIPEKGTSRYRTERIIVRLYGAELPVASSQILDWNTPGSWMKGTVPGANTHVFIPRNSQLAVNQTPASTVELLTNLGNLEIKQGTSLTVTGNTEIIPEQQ